MLYDINMYERKKSKASIIVPNWFTTMQHGKYGEDETFWLAEECIKKLIERTNEDDYELIFIDNGSTLAGTGTFFSQADIIVKNKHNLGFAPAINQGVYLARGEYIVAINNDVIVWPGWLDALINVFKQDLSPPPGVVMPALMKETSDAKEALEMEEIDLRANAGKYGPGAEFGSLWVIPQKIKDEIIKMNNGYFFDENFKLGMGEDRWLWQQIRLAGYETYRCHDTRVFHQGNMTISKVKDRRDYTTKNREYLSKLKKQHGLPDEPKKAVPLT